MHYKTNVVKNPESNIFLSFNYRGYYVCHVNEKSFGVLCWMFEPINSKNSEEREWRTSEEDVLEAIDEYENEKFY